MVSDQTNVIHLVRDLSLGPRTAVKKQNFLIESSGLRFSCSRRMNKKNLFSPRENNVGIMSDEAKSINTQACARVVPVNFKPVSGLEVRNIVYCN